MKEIKRTVKESTFYVCDVCNKEHTTQAGAIECEKKCSCAHSSYEYYLGYEDTIYKTCKACKKSWRKSLYAPSELLGTFYSVLPGEEQEED